MIVRLSLGHSGNWTCFTTCRMTVSRSLTSKSPIPGGIRSSCCSGRLDSRRRGRICHVKNLNSRGQVRSSEWIKNGWFWFPVTFPSVSLETTKAEVVEYYRPSDFKIGETIVVFGRRFLIYDMDDYTKNYYRDHFGYTDFTPICVFPPRVAPLDIVRPINLHA